MAKQSKKTTTKPKVEKKDVVNPAQPETKEKKPKKKTGSPSMYASKVKPYLEKIAQYIRCGVTEGQICEFYDVGKTAWAQYKKENPELNETLYKAKCELKTNLINKSFDVAMGYTYQETTTVEFKDKEGNVTGSKVTTYERYAKADAGMIQFLLINRFPDEFARDPQAIELRKKALELAEQGKIPPDAEGI